ncbi:MAG: hypothetical protein Kow00124_00860 [Anaerolineae bacterium]
MSQDAAAPRGEQTRQAILEAAERLFLMNGYHGTSMRQIAREAGGISVGAIYNHFPGKEHIFQALMEMRSPYAQAAPFFDSIEVTTGPRMIVQAFVHFQQIWGANLNFVELALIDLREFDGSTIRALVNDVLPSILHFIERARSAPGLRGDISTSSILRALVAMVIGYAFTSLVGVRLFAGSPYLTDINDLLPEQSEIIDILLHGIADQESRA